MRIQYNGKSKILIRLAELVNQKADAEDLEQTTADLQKEIDEKADKSAIPTVGDGVLSVQRNGKNVGTFSANAAENASINIPVPEKVSELENDAGYGTYTKPAAGIPKSDLASGVQASLGKADTALQKHQDISGKQDKLTAGANITISGNTISAKDTTYGNASASTAGLMSAADKSKLDKIIEPTRYLRYNATGGMVKGTWYKFASFTCTQYYNYSTAIFVVGYAYTGLQMFRIVAGTSRGKPTAERISAANITGNVANKIGYVISENTVNFFIKTVTDVYGYVGRLAASAETGDYIQQTDLVAATSAETTAIVPIGNIVTDISASNTAAKLSTARKINTVEYDGTKDIMIPRSGMVCHEAGGTGGQQGYVKIATIKITAQYANMPTIIYYRNRGAFPVKLVIMFSNSDTTDPGLYVLEQTVELVNYNWKRAYMNKTAAGTWDLIIAKSEAWDSVQILDCQPANHISVTFTNVHISTLPSTAITSTVYERAMVTSTVAAAKTLTDSGWTAMTVEGYAISGTVKYRTYGKQITITGSVVLKADIATSYPAPQYIASTTFGFSSIVGCSGVGRSSSGVGAYVVAENYSGDNLVCVYALGSKIAAGSTLNFTITGFID